jgi:hypothetical protein
MLAYHCVVIVNLLPEGFPGTKFKKDAREYKSYGDRLIQGTFGDVLAQIVCGE